MLFFRAHLLFTKFLLFFDIFQVLFDKVKITSFSIYDNSEKAVSIIIQLLSVMSMVLKKKDGS